MLIREITENDCGHSITTGEQKFDTCPYCKDKLTLKFYFLRHKSGNYMSYVLEETGKIIGVLCFQINGDSVYLSRVGIQDVKQDMGHGMALIKHLLAEMIKFDVFRITCKVHSEKLKWFTDLGFKKINDYCDPHWGNCSEMELSIIFTKS